MSIASFGALFAVWLAAITLPGPDTLQLIRTGTRDRRAGVWCAIGIMVGNTIWIVSSLLGLSALMVAEPAILHLVQLVGGAYIAWMGWGSLRGGLRTLREKTSDMAGKVVDAVAAQGEEMGAWRALRLGAATNLSNPKAVVFFASIFAQFVRPDMSAGWTVGIAAFLVVTGLAWFIGFAVAVRALAEKIIRNGAVIDIAAGVIFLVIAAVMAAEGARGLLS